MSIWTGQRGKIIFPSCILVCMCVSFRNEFGLFNYFAVYLMLPKVGAGLMESNPVCSECGFLKPYWLMVPSKTTGFASVWDSSVSWGEKGVYSDANWYTQFSHIFQENKTLRPQEQKDSSVFYMQRFEATLGFLKASYTRVCPVITKS